MKKTKKIIGAVCLAIVMTMVVPSIVPSLSGTITVEAASKVKLNKTKATVYVGKSTQLKVTGTKKKVTWKSSNKKIATVTSKGKVTAKKKGTATITATVSGKKYTCKVTVKNTGKPDIEVKSLTNANSIVRTIKLKIKNNDSRVIYVDNYICVYDFLYGYSGKGYSAYLSTLPSQGVPLPFGGGANKKCKIKSGETKIVSISEDGMYFKGNSNTYYRVDIEVEGKEYPYYIYPETNEGYFK